MRKQPRQLPAVKGRPLTALLLRRIAVMVGRGFSRSALQRLCILYKACHRTRPSAHKPYKVCGASSFVGRRCIPVFKEVRRVGTGSPCFHEACRQVPCGYAAPALLAAALAQSPDVFLLAQPYAYARRMPHKKSLVVVTASPACGRGSAAPPAASVPQCCR